MTKQFAVTGMTCAACSAHVERAVSQLPGVKTAAVVFGVLMAILFKPKEKR